MSLLSSMLSSSSDKKNMGLFQPFFLPITEIDSSFSLLVIFDDFSILPLDALFYLSFLHVLVVYYRFNCFRARFLLEIIVIFYYFVY